MFKKRRDRSGDRNRKKVSKIEEVILPNAKLRFCTEQLQNLNYLFQKKLRDKVEEHDRAFVLAKSVTERLVQRLICCAGMLDARFSAKFLVANHELLNENLPSKNLEYILRLDSLSTPNLYPADPKPRYSVIETDPEYPPAYARVRLHTTAMKTWGDCANSAGYLRRDKVQARLVQLLAQAAASDFPGSPLNVDESVHCGAPGKIVEARILHEILKIPSEQHVFYGPGGNVPRFPDPRDFRLAIVDEPGGVRLKVEFLSPALANIAIDVRILVGIGVEAWPSTTDFPGRVTLGHTDCLLYHQAAQTGMYLVGYGVQSSAWQIRLPAAQDTILNHYGPTSTLRTILDVLFDTLQEIDKIRTAKKQSSYKILNRYILLTLVLNRLEEHSVTPSHDLLEWSPMYLSTHVLKILDKTMSILHAQHLPNYFFKKSNILVNPGHLCEDDYVLEANNIKSCIIRLFDEALMSTKGNDDFCRVLMGQESETVLLHKWRDLIDNLQPPGSTRGRRFCFVGARNKEVAHTEYTCRQLEYIGLLLQNILEVKGLMLKNEDSVIKVDSQLEENHIEDVIYLLVAIMDQARDAFLSQANITNRPKVKAQFNAYTSKLIDFIRKEKEIAYEDDLSLVKVVLKWLYKAMDQHKRYLAPVLRPYLHTLFHTSHSVSWHLEFIKQRLSRDETEALGHFAKLVNAQKITPAAGLIDAVNKNWLWAKSMLRFVERSTLRVVFVEGRGKVHRHILSLPSYQKHKSAEDLLQDSVEAKKMQTLPTRNYFSTIMKQKFQDEYPETAPQHQVLKSASPLTMLIHCMDRRGQHRGYGDILKSLQSMQKLNMFHQVMSTLPQEDRCEIMDVIHSMESMKSKKSKTWSNTLPSQKMGPKCEKYTPKEESAGIRIENKKKGAKEKKMSTLIGTCRAARVREDNSVLLFQDSFKIKSLLNKSESFKF